MHLPDGFLDARTCLGAACLAGAGVAWAARQVTARWTDRTVPLLGLMSAFVFAAQMVNFPVLGGTSGHLLGGALAAVLLGPAAGVLALAIVVGVQCLLFQDGGLTALGANTLNIALVGVLSGYAAGQLVRRFWPGRRGLLAGTALGAWVSVLLAAALCALELAAAGTAPLRLALPAMVFTHAAIGLGEAAATVAVVAFVARIRPDVIYAPTAAAMARIPLGALLRYGLAVSVGLALLLAPLASHLPDGLERVAADLGFAASAHARGGPLADYQVLGVRQPWLGVSVAGFLGTVVSFAAAWAVALGLARWWRRSRSQPGA